MPMPCITPAQASRELRGGRAARGQGFRQLHRVVDTQQGRVAPRAWAVPATLAKIQWCWPSGSWAGVRMRNQFEPRWVVHSEIGPRLIAPHHRKQPLSVPGLDLESAKSHVLEIQLS